MLRGCMDMKLQELERLRERATSKCGSGDTIILNHTLHTHRQTCEHRYTRRSLCMSIGIHARLERGPPLGRENASATPLHIVTVDTHEVHACSRSSHTPSLPPMRAHPHGQTHTHTLTQQSPSSMLVIDTQETRRKGENRSDNENLAPLSLSLQKSLKHAHRQNESSKPLLSLSLSLSLLP